jgi:DNA-binding protein HU-beta
MSINKTDLAAHLAAKVGINKSLAVKTVDALIGLLVENLEAGTEVNLRGLGTFKTSIKEAREARNPRTGDMVPVPAKRVVKFKAQKGVFA